MHAALRLFLLRGSKVIHYYSVRLRLVVFRSFAPFKYTRAPVRT